MAGGKVLWAVMASINELDRLHSAHATDRLDLEFDPNLAQMLADDAQIVLCSEMETWRKVLMGKYTPVVCIRSIEALGDDVIVIDGSTFWTSAGHDAPRWLASGITLTKPELLTGRLTVELKK